MIYPSKDQLIFSSDLLKNYILKLSGILQPIIRDSSGERRECDFARRSRVSLTMVTRLYYKGRWCLENVHVSIPVLVEKLSVVVVAVHAASLRYPVYDTLGGGTGRDSEGRDPLLSGIRLPKAFDRTT